MSQGLLDMWPFTECFRSVTKELFNMWNFNLVLQKCLIWVIQFVTYWWVWGKYILFVHKMPENILFSFKRPKGQMPPFALPCRCPWIRIKEAKYNRSLKPYRKGFIKAISQPPIVDNKTTCIMRATSTECVHATLTQSLNALDLPKNMAGCHIFWYF